MIVVTKYKAADGAEFINESDCIHYEHLCKEVAAAVAKLKPNTATGEGFIQQSAPIFIGVQSALVRLFERENPSMVDQHTEWAREATRPAGHTLIGRYMDDCGPRPIYHAWSRIMCTDNLFREYSQPYYAVKSNETLPEPQS